MPVEKIVSAIAKRAQENPDEPQPPQGIQMSSLAQQASDQEVPELQPTEQGPEVLQTSDD